MIADYLVKHGKKMQKLELLTMLLRLLIYYFITGINSKILTLSVCAGNISIKFR